ncbi:CAP-Gly domain-containing protein [Ditylenchus destructor]|nr:CAP-Gly domain-containing protein [Ditylenchus destructor]
MLNFQITSSKSEFPYEARYPATMALVEFKIKLELVVGIYAQDMKLELRNAQGKFLAELFGDDKTLEELGVANQSVVHVIDTTGNSPLSDGLSGDSSQARYVMNDDKYANRKDTARKWMQELGVGEGASPTKVPDYIKIGMRCFVKTADQPEKTGRVAFIGETHFKPGVWIGVIYDRSVGKNDGSIDGYRYFTCEANHGGFVVPKAVQPLLDENVDNSKPSEEIDSMPAQVREEI